MHAHFVSKTSECVFVYDSPEHL